MKAFAGDFVLTTRVQTISLQGSSRMNYTSQSPTHFAKSQRPARQQLLSVAIKPFLHVNTSNRINYRMILADAYKIQH